VAAPYAAGVAEVRRGVTRSDSASLIEIRIVEFQWKCAGLNAAGLSATVAVSSVTLGGMVKHLAYVEDLWCSRSLHGRGAEPPWDTVDWKADPDSTRGTTAMPISSGSRWTGSPASSPASAPTVPGSVRNYHGRMTGAFPSNAARSSPGSWLHTWLEKQKRHPDTFDCGVRVRDDSVNGGTARWRYRTSAVDQLVSDGIVTLHHGTKITLRLRIDDDPFWHGEGSRPRHGHAVLAAVDAESGARLLVSVPPAELARFGVDLL
jgi:hypothetical protein